MGEGLWVVTLVRRKVQTDGEGETSEGSLVNGIDITKLGEVKQMDLKRCTLRRASGSDTGGRLRMKIAAVAGECIPKQLYLL
jgi:hypothetical protein